MIRFAADENLNYDIVRALRRHVTRIDIVRVQEAGLAGADDPTVLEWAAEDYRLLLTHDVATMVRHAYDRIRKDLGMPGVFVIPLELGIGSITEDILLIAECSAQDEWAGQVRYLPL